MTQRLEPDPELDDLVRKLNTAARGGDESPASEDDSVAHAPPAEPPASRMTDRERRWRLPPPGEQARERLAGLLAQARSAHASDLLLVVGSPPVLRVDGKLRSVGENPLAETETAELCAALLPPRRRPELEARGSADFAAGTRGAGRFRCNIHRERGYWAAAVRLFPDAAPDLEKLCLPDSLARFADLDHGLVLVTGPTGSGKSTTLAALIRTLLTRRRVHLISVEDPVEYEHAHAGSVVEHVEVGRDIGSYPEALRSILRQDPDVMLIGEMRDPESMSLAITAGETGHLVFSTLHTGDAPQTVHRIIDSYPAEQIDVVRTQLSASLAGVISQQLLPRADGKGRVPAVEVLVNTPAVRNLIRQGKTEQLRSQLTLERGAGMLDLDRSLAELVRRGLIEREEARTRARVPEVLELLLRPGG